MNTKGKEQIQTMEALKKISRAEIQWTFGRAARGKIRKVEQVVTS